MPKRLPLILLPWFSLTCGCFTYSPHQQAFYASPFNGNSLGYHPLPMHTDTTRTAVYVSASVFAGGANDLLTDRLAGGDLSLHVGQHGDIFQWHYGLDLTAGNYKLGTWKQDYQYTGLFPFIFVGGSYPPPVKVDELNALSGNRFFGGGGFSGGFNGVIPMGQGEWRFLGVETALHEEFGDYRRFRGKLPDSVASYNVRHSFFGTAGLFTEWVFRTRQGDFGFRLGSGWVLGNGYRSTGVYDSIAEHPLRYNAYGAFTFHYTWSNYTIWYQLEAGTHADTYRLGFALRLDQPRLPKKHPVQRPDRPLPPMPPRPWNPFSRSSH